MKRVLLALLALGTLDGAAGAAPLHPRFSIDPASPSIAGSITPDDILRAGPAVFTHGSALGLQDAFFGGLFDNLQALSFGRDPIGGPLFFSVDRTAVGRRGSAVNVQAQPGAADAAGDIFQSLPPAGTNRVFRDGRRLGLAPGFFGDDLDGLELDSDPRPFTYFSIDALSATNAFGVGTLAANILISSGTGGFGIFADGPTHIGLNPLDDLDALVLWDRVNPGVLDPGIDMALFSLSSFSPSTFTSTGNPYLPGVSAFLSPSDVLFTDFTGGFALWAEARRLGLRSDDELDALDTMRAVPGPPIAALMALTLLLLLPGRARRSSSPTRSAT